VCDKVEQLRSYEVTFAYVEAGVNKTELVKLRVCPRCAYRLHYRKIKEAQRQAKTEYKAQRKREKLERRARKACKQKLEKEAESRASNSKPAPVDVSHKRKHSHRRSTDASSSGSGSDSDSGSSSSSSRSSDDSDDSDSGHEAGSLHGSIAHAKERRRAQDRVVRRKRVEPGESVLGLGSAAPLAPRDPLADWHVGRSPDSSDVASTGMRRPADEESFATGSG
jgi:hypothetical protein